jgi:iron complex outermembrane receptor protein
MTRSTIARAVRYSLWTSAMAMAPTLPVLAQNQAAEPEQPQTVVVTGSRIQRPELDSTTPILALGAEDLKSQGLVNIADIAAQLPQFSASFGSSRTQSTFSGAAASGLNLFNLRNLGEERTVSLINGRRAPGGTTTSTGLDFNLIPTANIERFELVTGGASAIYGADAVAGVVNLITRKNFEGIEFGANYSTTKDSDNTSPGGYAMFGKQFGDIGHVTLTAEYQKQGEVSCRDRFLCAQDFSWFDSSAPPVRGPAAYSGVGLAAKFQAGTTGTFFTARNGSYTDPTNAQANHLIAFSTPVDGYNRNADRTLAIPTKRTMVAAEGEMNLPAGMTSFIELNYGKSETDAPFEGHPFQSTAPGSFFGADGVQASVPITNPFIPAALRAQAATNGVDPVTGVLNWQQRFNAITSGGRGATNEREMLRGVIGVRGNFESLAGMGSDWSWEVSHVHGRTKLDSLSDGNVGTDRLFFGLRAEQDPGAPAGTFRCIDATARAAGCVPINPFAAYTDAEKAWLTVRAGQHGHNELSDSTAYVSGTLFNLPAGGFKTVLGIENRSFAGFLDYDDAINNALVTGNQIGDTDYAKIQTNEAFTEFEAPILADKPAFKSLDLTGSFRHSDPKKGDNYNTWGYGLNWQPVDGLRLRASKARAVRTPTPDDLSGVGQTFGVIADPCTVQNRTAAANPVRDANCLADGVPANFDPGQNVQQSVSGFVGGNPNLSPEVGDTLTFGFVWQPPFLQGFNLSVDRFRIDIDSVINTVGRQNKADSCYDTVERFFCEDLTRGPNVNLPVGAPPVALLTVNDQLINVAKVNVAGYDIEMGYTFNFGSAGRLSLRGLMTIYDKADEQFTPDTPVQDFLGYAGGSTSDQGWIKRQGVSDIRYSYRQFGVGLHSRYIVHSLMAPGFEDFGAVGSHLYHDLRFSYDFGGEGSQVYLGIDNITDKAPPFFASGTSGTQALDTIPAYYDVFGRTYFGGVRYKF